MATNANVAMASVGSHASSTTPDTGPNASRGGLADETSRRNQPLSEHSHYRSNAQTNANFGGETMLVAKHAKTGLYVRLARRAWRAKYTAHVLYAMEFTSDQDFREFADALQLDCNDFELLN